MKNKREFIIAVFFLLIGVSAAYIFNIFQELNILKPARVEQSASVINQEIPMCVAFRCPVYSDFTVDKDPIPNDESIVIVPTAMTDGAGKLMIIKNGKILFESGEYPEISVEPVNDGNGFILCYETDLDTHKY